MRWAFLLVFALVGLNIGLTHQNLWPTPWIRVSSEISLELVLLVLGVMAAAAFGYRFGPRFQWGLAVALLLIVVGRYVDVTAPALFGRRIDLYWDVRHLPAVAAMAVDTWSPWQIAALAALLALGLALLLFGLRWATAILCRAATHLLPRTYLLAGASGLFAIYGTGMISDDLAWERRFSLPVTPVYAKQFAAISDRMLGSTPADLTTTTPLPPLADLNGRDVFVIFLESYGRVAMDDETHARRVRAALADLQRRSIATGWESQSAFLTAPTFGGASWLSHASLLAGRPIRTHDAYQIFLHGETEQLVDRFRTLGYRSVMLTPGIRGTWPEGLQMRFDQVLSANDVEYNGPAFGWWRIPDQASLEQLTKTELAADPRPPLFVVFPTIMSHFPFGPTPPYVEDWSSLSAVSSFENLETETALALGDGVSGDLDAAYVRSVVYNLTVIGGFLANRAPRDALVLVIGDHQPPSVVSGELASWDVPIHVFARNGTLPTNFEQAGFRSGTVPNGSSIGGIDRVTTWLLAALETALPVESYAGVE